MELLQLNAQSLAQSTILLVLSAETVLFGTLVMSYLYLRTSGSGTPFTHVGLADLVIASVNTLILLASAIFAWGAARAIADNRGELLKTNLLITVTLGVVFVIGQIVEFSHSGMQIDNSAFGGAFFALISFHALHVIAGLTFLAINFGRAQLGDFNARRHIAVTMGAWFWYYVVAVWIVLFSVLYVV